VKPGGDILFICTGNIFRSMTAEHALRAALGSDTGCRVRSAGLIDAPHQIVSFVKDYLATKGLDVSHHQPTKLARAILDEAGLAVAMGTGHRRQLAEGFDYGAPLFSEIAYGTEEPLLDVFEVVPDWQTNEAAAMDYGQWVIDYIIDGMPGFLDRMPKLIQT